jgi:hypothetical protein
VFPEGVPGAGLFTTGLMPLPFDPPPHPMLITSKETRIVRTKIASLMARTYTHPDEHIFGPGSIVNLKIRRGQLQDGSRFQENRLSAALSEMTLITARLDTAGDSS